jgi:hypothetical protein
LSNDIESSSDNLNPPDPKEGLQQNIYSGELDLFQNQFAENSQKLPEEDSSVQDVDESYRYDMAHKHEEIKDQQTQPHAQKSKPLRELSEPPRR